MLKLALEESRLQEQWEKLREEEELLRLLKEFNEIEQQQMLKEQDTRERDLIMKKR
jgi:hypothetical protein